MGISGPRICISIHALLAESDRKTQFCAAHPHTFLSTLSLRRATKARRKGRKQVSHFYPRSPCGERLIFMFYFFFLVIFLSTLSLRRATFSILIVLPQIGPFLSTLSLRRATRAEIHASTQQEKFLSTLSLRRATSFARPLRATEYHFYPRSPCGERLRGGRIMLTLIQFLSTLSLRRATNQLYNFHIA